MFCITGQLGSKAVNMPDIPFALLTFSFCRGDDLAQPCHLGNSFSNDITWKKGNISCIPIISKQKTIKGTLTGYGHVSVQTFLIFRGSREADENTRSAGDWDCASPRAADLTWTGDFFFLSSEKAAEGKEGWRWPRDALPAYTLAEVADIRPAGLAKLKTLCLRGSSYLAFFFLCVEEWLKEFSQCGSSTCKKIATV